MTQYKIVIFFVLIQLRYVTRVGFLFEPQKERYFTKEY